MSATPHRPRHKPETRPAIPDYAIDMHTRRGIADGRTVLDFLNEGSRVAPELVGRDKTYRKRIEALVRPKRRARKA